MAKATAKELVAEHLEYLKIQDLRGLFLFAKGRGLDSRAGFVAFKKALLENGIDYDAIKAGRVAEKTAALESAAAGGTIELFSDAKASAKRFGIAAKDGTALWYGRFFDDDRDFDGEQSSGELAAAKKAIWLAAKAKEAKKLSALKLILNVDAEWLTWANGAGLSGDDKRGGKARALGELANKLNVLLEVRHIPGSENPADRLTIGSGFKKWSDNDLAALVS